MVRVLQVSGSTFHRLGAAAIEVAQGDAALSVRIADVTIHDAADGIVLNDVEQAVVSGVILSAIRNNVAGGTEKLTVRNSCVFDSKKHQHISGIRCLNCLEANPEFYDPNDDDFSLLPESPCLWLGKGYTPIGDPRWTGDATKIARSKRERDVAVRWSGGVGVGVIAVFLAFSAMRRHFHKSTSASLRERDAHYRPILESSTDGIVFIDPNSHQILEMNDAFIARHNLQNWPEKVHQVEALFDNDDDLTGLFEAVNDDRPYSAHHRLKLADGSIMDAEIDVHTLAFRGSKTVCLVTHDISQWKNETRKLIEVEEHLQHLLSSSPAVLYSRPLDQTFGFSFVSASVANLLQLRVADLLSDPQYFKWRIHMEDLPRVMGEQRRVLNAGKQAQEYRIQNGRSEYRWIRDETFLVYDDDGSPLEIVGTIVDVTSRVVAEQSRMAVEAELEQQKVLSMRADRLRSLGEMAAGIAHELNQPLVGVRGCAEHTLIGMERGWDMDEEKLVERLETIIEQVDRMVHIIDHVRRFARQAGDPQKKLTQVNDIVTSSVSLLGTQLRLSGVELRTTLGVHLPEVFVNPFSLEEVVLNLVVNARDALEGRNGEHDPPVVEVRTDTDERGWVRIGVVHNGCGIPAELQDRVWQPFFTTKDPDRGTGLGLSICRTIIEQSAGRLELSSGIDRGTTVTIILPPPELATAEDPTGTAGGHGALESDQRP